MNFALNCFFALLQLMPLFLLVPIRAENELLPLQLTFPFNSFSDGSSKALLKMMLNYSKKRFAIPTEKFNALEANKLNKFLTHCILINENFGGLKGLERAIGEQKNGQIHTKLAKFLKNVKAKVTTKNDREDKYNEALSRILILFDMKTKNIDVLMRECTMDFSILRVFYEMANFILQNAYISNFEERAECLAAFWNQFKKKNDPKLPHPGISLFLKKKSTIQIYYANNVFILNTKTADELLERIMANIGQNNTPNQNANKKAFENCDEIISELSTLKWLEEAFLAESDGLNLKELYEKILEVFENSRQSPNSVEESIECLTEFSKLHSLNYLSKFVLKEIVQWSLTLEMNLLNNKYRNEMKLLYEALDTIMRKHFGTAVGQISISKDGERAEETDGSGEGSDTDKENDQKQEVTERGEGGHWGDQHQQNEYDDQKKSEGEEEDTDENEYYDVEQEHQKDQEENEQ